MCRVLFSVIAVLVAVAATYYQIVLKPRLAFLGFHGGQPIEYLNVDKCHIHPELGLEACEKLVLHQPSGLLYLACSSRPDRVQWTPSLLKLNASTSMADYVATYNPTTSEVNRLTVSGYDDPRGLQLHGMDVVPSAKNPSELFIFLVNHRAPEAHLDPTVVGANSSIEIFKTPVAGSLLTHLHTIESTLVSTPNDVLGSSDGKSVYVTNDFGFLKSKRGRPITTLLGLANSHITYCHVDKGCKIALDKIAHPNGIVRAKDGSIIVAGTTGGGLYITEEQVDHSLVMSDILYPDRPLDNLSVDSNGDVWAAGFPNALGLSRTHYEDPTIPGPTSALRITLNKGEGQYFGEKWRIEKIVDDDGQVISASTSVVHDAERKKLYMHGLIAPYLTICDI